MTEPKTRMLQVSAIEAGTVIDHIDSRRTFEVAGILNLQGVEENVLIGINLESAHGGGRKGIIKIAKRFLTQEEVNRIAAVAPDATLNIIENYDVVEKFKVRIPDVIEGTFRCFNPNCISNDQKIPNRFYMVEREPLTIRCHYCERQMGQKDIKPL